MEFKEFTGKTVDEAIELGLKELGLSRENAEIKVLEEGKKKLFGSIKARVEIAAKKTENAPATNESCCCGKTDACAENTAKTCEKQPVDKDGMTDGERTVVFLEGLFDLLKITACTELVAEGEKVEINVTAANTTSIIGKRGVMLDAIQTLAGAVANTGREEYKRVVVDCENYRENRETTLQKLAANLAAKAQRMGRKIKLEPMNPYERRIIHSALSEIDGVKTESEGKEPNRYIVVIPDNLEDETLPAIPARSERRGNDRNERRSGGRGGKGGFGGRSKSGFAGKSGGFKKFNRDNGSSSNSGGTTMKASTEFFGICLGNSGNSGEDDK